MKWERRRLIAGAASAGAAFGLVKYPAGAAEFNFKLGTTTAPTQHPVTVRAYDAAAQIKHDTDGRVNITVYPINMLGSDTSMLSQTRLGAIEFVLMVDSVLMTLVPAVGVNVIPFAFATHRDALDAADGPLGQYTRSAIVKANLNLYPFDKKFDSGFFLLANNVRPIRGPEDVKGLKIRIQPALIPTATYKALGASPVSVDGNQIYVALQTKLVDGAEVTLIGIETLKFYEVLKYVSLTNREWQGYTMLVNTDVWAKLPKNLRDICEKNFSNAALADRRDIDRFDQTIVPRLEKERGLIFNQADVPAFRQALSAAGMYGRWRDQFGADAWAMLEKTVGRLA